MSAIVRDWSSATREVFLPNQPTDVFSLIDEAFRGREQENCIIDVSDPQRAISYQWGEDIREGAARLAQSYATCGLQKGDGVFFLTRTSPMTVAAQIGSLMAGTLSVPGQKIPEEFGHLQAAEIIRDIAYRRNVLVEGGALKDGGMLLIDPSLAYHLPPEVSDLFRSVQTFDYHGDGTFGNLMRDQSGNFVRPILGPHDKTFALFTSGSTGKPKCVVYTQQMTATNLVLLKKWLRIEPGTTALNALPINHLHGLMQQLFAVLVGGGTSLLMENFEPERFVALMEHADIVSGVPHIWHEVSEYLARLDPSQAAALCRHPRVFTAGSDRIGHALRQKFFEASRGRKLVVRGGSTEQQHMYGNRLDEPDMGEGVGFLFASYEISIRKIDDPGQEVAPGEMGELCSRGPCVIERYVNDEEATQDAFTSDRYFRSGDGVRVQPDGMIVYVSRLKNFIKSGGERISPSDVEAYFDALACIDQIQVVGLEDSTLVENQLMDASQDRGYGQRIAAIVVLKPGFSSDDLEGPFCEACRSIPHSYLRPRTLIVADRLFKSGPGKINPQLAREALETNGTYPGVRKMWTVLHGGNPRLVPSVIRSRPLQVVAAAGVPTPPPPRV